MKTCRGNDVPVIRDGTPYIHDCRTERGGTKTIGIPQFHLAVSNPPDLLWRDDDFQLVQENNGDFILIDNA